MNIEMLKQQLNSLIDNEVNSGVSLFFRMKRDGGFFVKKSVFDDYSLLKKGIFDTIKNIKRTLDDDTEFSLKNISDIDDRSNVYYIYDLENKPSFFLDIQDVDTEHDPNYYSGNIFNFENNSLSDIDAFILRIGTEDNHITTYRKNFPINIYKQGKSPLYITKSDTQFSVLKNDILKIDNKIDLLKTILR